MDASLASLQARLATFQTSTSTKSRRTSSRSKKAGAKSKAAWPLASPSAQDLAYAGFVWKPTTASPDNVQCYFCECQLDGWEESDVPAFEHLTHSPSCGYAVVTCIRLRNGDPGRVEEDPTSEAMVSARRATFGELWPLDSSEGYPSSDQMVHAGWYYDPADGATDGVTCAYCNLSLDAWDVGDNPMEEHRRRSPDCLFFTLFQLYNAPAEPEPVKKAKRTSTKAKRTSTRSSTASTASKTTRRKKRTSEQATDDLEAFSEIPPAKKPTRGKKRASEQPTSEIESSSEVPAIKKPTRGKKRASEQATNELESFSEVSAVKKPTRGKKRASEQATDDLEAFSEMSQPARKRIRSSSISSFPDDLAVGTPKKTPTEFKSTAVSSFQMSSLPASLAVGTPKKTPTHLKDTGVADFEMSSLPGDLLVGTPKKTPTMMRDAEGASDSQAWQPTDMEAFFSDQTDPRGFLNDVVVDGGLDEVAAAGASPADLHAAVSAGLTAQEKGMSVEQWVLYNATRGEEKLRVACERQILAFQAEGRRALGLLESIPTY
ncbi:hypothetical protein N0V83_004732 [Neocucurbitaria cava]|uniref:Inhibitor of apoptosis repeat-containing protein n=1 Tax=Neocucurbitaria cava TaxID=798079 RepID=A0A9W8Y9P2_9PLEO|nr:hypothetical protein N0V83_004732 [Neocucurbitaria cava]